MTLWPTLQEEAAPGSPQITVLAQGRGGKAPDFCSELTPWHLEGNQRLNEGQS